MMMMMIFFSCNPILFAFYLQNIKQTAKEMGKKEKIDNGQLLLTVTDKRQTRLQDILTD
jgi:hypothetical protein